jgi:hypothetical protein
MNVAQEKYISLLDTRQETKSSTTDRCMVCKDTEDVAWMGVMTTKHMLRAAL